jgi:hypothetical protein
LPRRALQGGALETTGETGCYIFKPLHRTKSSESLWKSLKLSRLWCWHATG